VQRLRYLLVLACGILAGGRSVEAVNSWQEWRARMTSDPSAADAYRTFFLVNLGTVVLSLCLAALLWHLLRPAAKTRQRPL
jgi:hypothetical protein